MLLFVWAFTGGRGTTPPSWGAALRVALSGAGLPLFPLCRPWGLPPLRWCLRVAGGMYDRGVF